MWKHCLPNITPSERTNERLTDIKFARSLGVIFGINGKVVPKARGKEQIKLMMFSDRTLWPLFIGICDNIYVLRIKFNIVSNLYRRLPSITHDILTCIYVYQSVAIQLCFTCVCRTFTCSLKWANNHKDQILK